MGERTSNLFAVLSDVSLQFDWYLFSNEINRLLLIFLPVVHKPVAIKFFGSISCDLECFKKVKRSNIFIRYYEIQSTLRKVKRIFTTSRIFFPRLDYCYGEKKFDLKNY